jgi:regulator of telomere elongation helicase 1
MYCADGRRRAVNQAVGRVIRHQHDYGAIILCDDRFSSDGVRSNISLWLRDRVEMIPTFGAAMVSLTGFFKARPSCCIKSWWG